MQKFVEFITISNEYCQDELIETTNQLKPNDIIFKIKKLKEQISRDLERANRYFSCPAVRKNFDFI